MELRLDLHIHSQASPDGRMPLEEIVQTALDRGLDGAAVCDHDRVLSKADAAAVRLAYPDFLLIPGVEVSTDQGHLLGLFVTEPIQSREFAAASRAIRAQGGLAVLAHPYEHSRDPGRPEPLAPFLDGVEVWNSRAERKNRQANAMAEDFARVHGLRRFGGSDAHVPREIGNGVTAVRARERTLDAVREALFSGETAVSGRRSLAVDTAASQFTRRRKTHAGGLSYCKWALFGIKCQIEDWIHRVAGE